MSGGEEALFRYARYYGAAYGQPVEIVKKRGAPAWLPADERRRNDFVVYFRRRGAPRKESLMTGHGPSFEDACRMVLDFYMVEREDGASDEEMEMRYAAAGV